MGGKGAAAVGEGGERHLREVPASEGASRRGRAGEEEKASEGRRGRAGGPRAAEETAVAKKGAAGGERGAPLSAGRLPHGGAPPAQTVIRNLRSYGVRALYLRAVTG